MPPAALAAIATFVLSSLPAAAAKADAAPRPWTILVYGGADNNADGPILQFLDGVRKAIDDDPGIDLLLLLDRSEGFSTDATLLGEDFTGARLFRLKKDSAERLSGGTHFPELTKEKDAELDTADAENLRRFIAWGKETSPASRYGLMIYSHANGRSMCPDEKTGKDMGISELSRVLTEKESLDFLALELCNMGGIEIAYEWRPGTGRFGADVLVAIPNAGPPLDWHRAFARIRSKGHPSAAAEPHLDPAAMTAADFGKLVIEEGRRGREAAGPMGSRAAHEAAGCYDLRAAADVKRAVDAMAAALAETDSKDAFLALRGGDDRAMNYDGDGPYVDLYDLCRRAAACEALSAGARARAKDAMAACDAFMVASFGMSGYRGFDGGKNGVFIVLPAPRPGAWRLLKWYTPGAFEEEGKDYGRWAFLADGGTPGNGKVETWLELIDMWFDDADDAGGVNGYSF